MAKKKERMVWMDLEMTGLDPLKDRIIEIATVITDQHLEVIAEGPNLIIHQPPRVMRAMDAWNREHHGASGLTQAVLDSKLTLKQAEAQTLQFIKQHCREKAAPLCGNSIHQDRRFLVRYMPKIDRYLHYRLVDVSTIKELVRRWYKVKRRQQVKGGGHRALADILESIEELKMYRKRYFKRPC